MMNIIKVSLFKTGSEENDVEVIVGCSRVPFSPNRFLYRLVIYSQIMASYLEYINDQSCIQPFHNNERVVSLCCLQERSALMLPSSRSISLANSPLMRFIDSEFKDKATF